MKRNIKYGSKFFLLFFVSFLFFEIYLRLTEISLPSSVYDDAKFGRSHKPNAKIFKIYSEGFCIGEVNKYGYLGPAYPPEKDFNTIRIALVGDSYVEGLQLFDRYHFRRLMENQLASLINKKVEVLNFGIGGIDFRGMYLIYKEKISKYHPDIILCLIKEEDLLLKDKLPVPALYIKEDSIKINYQFLNSAESKLRKKFAFIRKFAVGSLLKEAFEYYYLGRSADILLEKLNFFNSKSSAKTNNKGFLNNSDKFFDINRLILKELKNNDSSCNRKNIIVKTSNLPSNYETLIDSLDLKLYDLNDELLKQEEQGINLKYWKASKKMGHWNHLGHQIVAGFLKKKLFEFINQSNLQNNPR